MIECMKKRTNNSEMCVNNGEIVKKMNFKTERQIWPKNVTKALK